MVGEKSALEKWEEEVLAGHRWGQRPWLAFPPPSDKKGLEELSRLRQLRQAAQPLEESAQGIINQILGLEICNWNLEASILELCGAIGKKEPAKVPIGHMISISEERWRKVWAYYLVLSDWLPHDAPNGHATLLGICDPDQVIQKYIAGMLGERTPLKEFYVERFRLCLEFWLGGYPPADSARMKAHKVAVSVLDEEIKKLDPEGQIVHEAAMQGEGDGRLQPCSHKAFRRYDMIISSIGAGKWRAAMPRRGTDGLERSEVVERYLVPIEAWIDGRSKPDGSENTQIFEQINNRLGKADATKRFLASLLVSLLRSQQLAARLLAESRTKEKTK
jgi:hypothetical protein